MNKYQKAESRRIKKYVACFNRYGANVTYRKVKRQVRAMDRAFAKFARNWRRRNVPGCKEVWPLVDKSTDGLRVNYSFVDELSTDPVFQTRCMGNFEFKEEN